MISWLCAAPVNGWGRRERLAVTLAGVVPDIDGSGYVVDTFAPFFGAQTRFYQQYHHIFAHNLFFALFVAVIGTLIAKQRKVLAGFLCFVAANVHYLCDIMGSMGPDGYQWPIPYFYPISSEILWTWSGQWELNGWQNITIAGIVMLTCVMVSRRQGHSPFELVSKRIDEAVFEMAAAARAFFGLTRST